MVQELGWLSRGGLNLTGLAGDFGWRTAGGGFGLAGGSVFETVQADIHRLNMAKTTKILLFIIPTPFVEHFCMAAGLPFSGDPAGKTLK